MSPEGFKHVAYHKVFETDYTLWELEELRRPCDGATMLIAHARMARWSPRILKECLKHWHLFRTVVTAPIFAYPQVHDPKWEKFATAFGFQPLVDAAPCNDGEVRPIWIHYALSTDTNRKQADEPVGSTSYGSTEGL